jgi:cystathionine beta-lyase
VQQGVFGYYRVPERYYEAFIRWEQDRHHFAVEKDWIRFSPGVVSAFHWAVQMFTKERDAVIVMTPVYYPILNAVKNNNRKLITAPLVNEQGTYRIDFNKFEQKIAEHEVKLFILCSPHNPVGRVWTKEELTRVVTICEKYQVQIVSDEIHQDITPFGHRHTPTLSLGRYQEGIMAITAPSKTFNLASGQNSIVILPNEEMRKQWDRFIQASGLFGGNSFGYIAATAAYEEGAGWLKSVLEKIRENYNYLDAFLKRYFPKAVLSPLEGTYLCWIDFGAYVPKGQMKEYIQGKCRLAVDYGHWFGGSAYQDFIRINLATSTANIEKAAEALRVNL